MKGIQEKRLENEIKHLSEMKSDIKSTIKKLTPTEYQVEIFIPNTLVNSQIDINLLLTINKNYPFNPPRLYFKTNFIFPSLSDSRDVLEDVLQTTWATHYRLVDIIEKIPKFIKDYINEIKKNNLILAGNYYIGEKYDLSFIESLPSYKKRVKEKELLNGKYTETNKILLISDIYFCVFELEKKSKFCTLTFWSNLKALITIKRIIKNNECKLYWRNKIKSKKLYELVLISPNVSELINLILSKMECFGINYDISQKPVEQRTGVLPDVNMDIMENEIEINEKKMKENGSKETEKVLLNLYEKAVEFYSASNNPRYEYFTEKIKELIAKSNVGDTGNDSGKVSNNEIQGDIKKNEDNKDKKEVQNEEKNKIKDEVKKEDKKEVKEDVISTSVNTEKKNEEILKKEEKPIVKENTKEKEKEVEKEKEKEPIKKESIEATKNIEPNKPVNIEIKKEEDQKEKPKESPLPPTQNKDNIKIENNQTNTANKTDTEVNKKEGVKETIKEELKPKVTAPVLDTSNKNAHEVKKSGIQISLSKEDENLDVDDVGEEEEEEEYDDEA